MKITLFAISLVSVALASPAAFAAAADPDPLPQAAPSCRPKTDNQAEKLCSPDQFQFICVDAASSFGLSCPTNLGYLCAQKQATCPVSGSIIALKGVRLRGDTEVASAAAVGSHPTENGLSFPSKGADGANSKLSGAEGKIHAFDSTSGTANKGAAGSTRSGLNGLTGYNGQNLNVPSDSSAPIYNDGQGASLLAAVNQAETTFDPKNQPTVDALNKAVRNWNDQVGNDQDSADTINKKFSNSDGNSNKSNTQLNTLKNSNDDCDMSSRLSGGSMNCSGTQAMMKVEQGMNIAGQISGSVTTQIAGAQAQSQALTAGTQSSVYRGAATTAKMSGETQATLGAFNAMMGMLLMEKGSKHSGNAKTLNKTFQNADGSWYTYEGKQYVANGDPSTMQSRALNQNEMNSAKQSASSEVQQAQSRMDKDKALAQASLAPDVAVKDQENLANAKVDGGKILANKALAMAQTGIDEQNKMASAAKDAGLTSLMQGAYQLAQGGLAIESAKQLEATANQLAAAEAQTGLTLTPPGQDAFPATGARTPTMITGDGAAPVTAAASADQQPTDSGVPPLGSGLPTGADGAPNGPPIAPGKFVPGGAGALAGAGGGAGGLTGGSTQAPGPDGNEKGPMAANPYVAGSTPVSGGPGMVGPANQGAKEERLNPAELMASALGLLKPKGDEGPGSSQSYGSGRSPAGTGSMNGLALPEDDIFKNVEGQYRRQVQAGNVGG